MAYEVFISYSHQDQTLRQKLDNHLSNLKQQNIITSWYDGDITAGTEWRSQIKQHLIDAQIILLLVSANFIASDFCYSTEMKQAIARHDANKARVIPILLHPTDWKGAPFAKLKMLPTDAKAITLWPTHDEGFVDVIQGIRDAINDLSIKIIPTNQERLWNIPYARNPLFTGRKNVLKRLYDALRASKTAALVGLGGIGRELARRAKASGMTVLAVDARPESSPEAVDELWPAERLRELLERSDFVAVCAPHTPETERLLDREKLTWMKSSAYLINVSRGVIVELAALTEALRQGRLAGAALDVFETEPLPADHPLWEMENVMITPHVAWMGPDSETRRLEVLRENLRRFTAGEPLLNVVDKARWF